MSCELTLARHGAVLIVLGLLSGFTTAFVTAPNMALAAHSIGIVQGTLGIALGFLWPVLVAHGYELKLTKYALIVGFYCNWLGAQLAGLWSAKMMATVTGSTMPEGATDWQEAMVAALLNASILVLIAFVYLVYILTKIIRSNSAGDT